MKNTKTNNKEKQDQWHFHAYKSLPSKETYINKVQSQAHPENVNIHIISQVF